jgi:NAD(P)-dependent dehydrogenase (short-subunit alcohol dehydrogenase family)
VAFKTWFITGAGRGFGRVWAEAALERGDSVAATARDLGTLAPLVEAWGGAVLPIELDVTDRDAAFAPVLRGQGHGHIIQVSSVGGVFALPGLGLYHASKWGLEGMTSSLALEVRSFGIKVTLVEPAGFATDWQGSSAVRASQLPAYEEFRANMPIGASARRGDPGATGPAILAIADAEEPPLRVFLGDQPLPLLRTEYARRIAEWEAWDDLSRQAFG